MSLGSEVKDDGLVLDDSVVCTDKKEEVDDDFDCVPGPSKIVEKATFLVGSVDVNLDSVAGSSKIVEKTMSVGSSVSSIESDVESAFEGLDGTTSRACAGASWMEYASGWKVGDTEDYTNVRTEMRELRYTAKIHKCFMLSLQF